MSETLGETGVAKRTLARILRDADDASAQTVRGWLLTRDGDTLQISRNEYSDWNMIRVGDVPQLVADLLEIAETPEPQARQVATLTQALTAAKAEIAALKQDRAHEARRLEIEAFES